MRDLISRAAAIKALGEAPKYKQRIIKTYAEGRNDQWFNDVARLLMVPSAQPERKKGHWKLQKDGNAICSECGYVQMSAWDLDGWDNFCHHCGADMRGEQDG